MRSPEVATFGMRYLVATKLRAAAADPVARPYFPVLLSVFLHQIQANTSWHNPGKCRD
jgi:hypothetical protein